MRLPYYRLRKDGLGRFYIWVSYLAKVVFKKTIKYRRDFIKYRRDLNKYRRDFNEYRRYFNFIPRFSARHNGL